LTGLRKLELYFLTWADLDLKAANLRVSGEGKVGFSPKDYEERVIELPPDLMQILSRIPHRAAWVFPNRKSNRLNHLLRRLKTVAARAGVASATLLPNQQQVRPHDKDITPLLRKHINPFGRYHFDLDRIRKAPGCSGENP
jgi:integrase